MNVPRTRRSQFSGNPVPSPKESGEGLSAQAGHRSVLLHEAVDALDIHKDDVVVDATLGGAGHAQEIAKRLGQKGTLIGFDLDEEAIERSRKALTGVSPRVELVQADFRDLTHQLETRGIKKITKALFDLGWSSYQLDSGRGFSLRTDEPLLMTYAKDGAVTARTVVNEWQEGTLADILYGFAQERYSRRIAKAILEYRAKRPIETSRELADIVSGAIPAGYRHGKIHPATKTFQALRIAVNDELGALSAGITSAFDMLEEGGRVAVITFHSVEDRAVKQLFASFEKEGRGRRLTKKPIVPSENEVKENRRARSAKLRIFEKRNDKKITENKQIQALHISGQV